MILVTLVAENELGGAQGAAADSVNSNITFRITAVHTKVENALEVVVYEESDSKGEIDYLGDEANVHDIERDRTVVVETMDEEEEVYTALNRRYTKQKDRNQKDINQYPRVNGT